MTPRFFHSDPLPESGECRLPDALAHHAVRVLRLGEGASIVLFDGRGGETRATLFGRGKTWHARLDARCDVDRESPLQLVLVQALAAGDKMDWIVQKAVELGVCGIVPLRAERSVLRLSAERSARRVAHWRQIIVSACEQSGRNRIPQLCEPIDLTEYLDRVGTRVDASMPAPARKLVLDPSAEVSLRTLSPPEGAVHLFVGPEGGWSDIERAVCIDRGCDPISLGKRVLRTETAGLAALAALQAIWGDF
ncbi:16S rRNA (uracil(1498)-N(3))-methyltransferase [Rhodocyclaceae bacterium SMB388]